MTDDRDLVLATAYRLMPSWRHLSVADIEYLPGGYSNRNYRIDIDGRRYALRRVDAATPRPRERLYLAIAAAPDLVAYDVQHGDMLTHWIDGATLAETPPTPGEAGAYLANLHQQIPTGVRRYDYSSEIEALFSRIGRVDTGVAAAFERLDWSARESRGCHNDLNPWNVIRMRTGGFRTLDWEFAGDNDRLFDLAGLCLGLGWQAEATAACAEAYRRASAEVGSPLRVEPERLRATLRAYQIREYAWAAAQLTDGHDLPGIRAQATTTRRALLASSDVSD